MIDVATWRARIGLYNVSTGGPSGRRAKVQRPSTSEWSLLLAPCSTAVELVTLIIVSLLLLAGDVEQNPGPGTVADNNTAVYGVFRSHFDQLVSGITQPVTLAGCLYARELINREMNNEIITLPASDADKAARLMNAVEARMKSDPRPARVLRELCEAMQIDDPVLKHVADGIRAALDQPAPPPITTPASTPHSPGLQKFIDFLKKRYQKFSPSLKEKSCVRPKEYIHLNLVSKDEEEEKEVKTECLMLQLHGDVVGIKKKRTRMEMENIGRSEGQSSVPQHILVEGAPGIGKTMFAWELCRQWAEGEMLQDWDIVLMLQLRSKGVREAKTLSDIFHHANSGIKQEVLEHITSTDGKGVFLIFEGYDELAEDQKTEGSIFHSLLVGEILPDVTIMVTSRPLASHSLSWDNVDQHIEIVGFTNDDIKSYVETACKKQPAILLADLKLFISSNPFVSSVMYIPLQCAILTALFIQNWKRKGKSYAPSTLTQLYTDLLLSLLRRYIDDHPDYKEQQSTISELSDFPREVQEQVWKLSQLAAKGLENRQYVFDSLPCDHMGLMQGAEEELILSSEVSYCFLHLTLQEYLAALHWSKLDSVEMARVVSESGLFPLTTLVSEGIERKPGFHWPALFFLAGLTKLLSVPLHLLRSSLTAGEVIEHEDTDDPDVSVPIAITEGSRKCNPDFFQLMFEAHSSDLVTKVFAEQNVCPSISTPLEGFVTAWCIANSDSTSSWYIGINSTLALIQLHPQLNSLDCHSTGHQHGRIVGLVQHEGDVSETLREIPKLHPCTQDLKLLSLEGEFTTEIKEFPPLPSLYPSLETVMIDTEAGDSTWLLPAFSRLHEISSLKSIVYTPKQNTQGNKGILFIPSKQYPPLFVVTIDGPETSPLLSTFVLPKTNSLDTLTLNDCPLTSADLNALCNCLCQTTTMRILTLITTKMETQGAKQLAAALEQNRSLKEVEVRDETIGDEGIRALEAVLENHFTVIWCGINKR